MELNLWKVTKKTPTPHLRLKRVPEYYDKLEHQSLMENSEIIMN